MAEGWIEQVQPPRLEQGDVHIWRISLEASVDRLVAWESALSDDERGRAARLRYRGGRRRFIACRGQVRRLLASYLDASPSALRFEYASLGKPRLAPMHGAGDLQFNVSHSGELALLAVSHLPDLGVDLEWMRTVRDMEGLARRYFSSREWRRLLELEFRERSAAFFQLWTGKEAVLKAVGKGLTMPLREVEFNLAPPAWPRLVRFGATDDEPRNWRIRHFAPAETCFGAVACRGEMDQVRLLHYIPSN